MQITRIIRKGGKRIRIGLENGTTAMIPSDRVFNIGDSIESVLEGVELQDVLLENEECLPPTYTLGVQPEEETLIDSLL